MVCVGVLALLKKTFPISAQEMNCIRGLVYMIFSSELHESSVRAQLNTDSEDEPEGFRVWMESGSFVKLGQDVSGRFEGVGERPAQTRELIRDEPPAAEATVKSARGYRTQRRVSERPI